MLSLTGCSLRAVVTSPVEHPSPTPAPGPLYNPLFYPFCHALMFLFLMIVGCLNPGRGSLVHSRLSDQSLASEPSVCHQSPTCFSSAGGSCTQSKLFMPGRHDWTSALKPTGYSGYMSLAWAYLFWPNFLASAYGSGSSLIWLPPAPVSFFFSLSLSVIVPCPWQSQTWSASPATLYGLLTIPTAALCPLDIIILITTPKKKERKRKIRPIQVLTIQRITWTKFSPLWKNW